MLRLAEGFNPYFTGYTTFTRRKKWEEQILKEVSILILLDILLLREKREICSSTGGRVSILILLDILLLQFHKYYHYKDI